MLCINCWSSRNKFKINCKKFTLPAPWRESERWKREERRRRRKKTGTTQHNTHTVGPNCIYIFRASILMKCNFVLNTIIVFASQFIFLLRVFSRSFASSTGKIISPKWWRKIKTRRNFNKGVFWIGFSVLLFYAVRCCAMARHSFRSPSMHFTNNNISNGVDSFDASRKCFVRNFQWMLLESFFGCKQTML